MNNLLKKSRHLYNILWVAIERVGLTIISIISFVVYAKVLSAYDMGLATIASSISQMIVVAIGSMFQDVLVREKHISSKHIDSTFWGGTIISLSVSLLLIIIVSFLEMDAIQKYLIYLSIIQIPMWSMASVLTGVKRHQEEYKVLTQASVLSRLLGNGIGIAMAFLGFGPYAIITQLVIVSGSNLLVLFALSGVKITFNFDFPTFWRMTKAGTSLSISSFIGSLTNYGMPLIISMFASTVASGYYGFATRLMQMPQDLIMNVLNKIALPVFSKDQNNEERLLFKFNEATNLSSFFTVPLFAGFAIACPYIIPALFGEKWNESIIVCQFLSLAMAIWITAVFFRPLLIAKTCYRHIFWISVTLTGTALLVTFLMSSEYGALAGAFGILAGRVLAIFYSYFVVKKVFKTSIMSLVRTTIKPMIASILLVLAFILGDVFVDYDNYLFLSLAIFACSLIYVGLVLVLDSTLSHRIKTTFNLGT